LKLQPHIQSSVATRSNQKLSFRYFGPFTILQRIGAVAYKLDLPSTSQIHPVVHVSLLKKHVPPQLVEASDLSTVCTDPTADCVPILVLDNQLVPHGNSVASKLLVQWNSASHMQTWEDELDIRRRYPQAPAWGQAASEGGGETVMTKKVHKRLLRLAQRQARRQANE